MPPTTQINIRRDTAANFTSANPTLALGEIAFETDTRRFKVGTGTTAWTSLAYAAQNPTSLTVTDTTASTSTTTGALQVAGGVGVGGALNVGGNATINSMNIGSGTAAASVNNTVFGRFAGDAITTGTWNVAIGEDALTNCTTGVTNIGIGKNTLQANNSANNVAVGHTAGQVTTGSNHTLIGANAGASAVGVNGITAVGSQALFRTLVADGVAVGAEALDINTLGTANVAVGRSALGAATTSIATVTTTVAGTGGTDGAKTAVQLERDSGGSMVTYPTVDLTVTSGAVAGTVTVATGGTGSTTSTLGGIVFKANAAGIAAGVPADWRCQLDTAATAANNTAVGHQAGLLQTTASSNTLVGANAGDALTTGINNTCIGHNAGGSLTTGGRVVAVGTNALGLSTTQNPNTAVGHGALSALTSGSENATLGTDTFSTPATVENSVAIGSRAGTNFGNSFTPLTSVSRCIYIGQQARPNADNPINEIIIGCAVSNNRTPGDGNNTVSIGNENTAQSRLRGGTFLSTGANGQSTQLGQSTTLLSALSGATVTATNLIPANCILLGVTARVTTAITGATTFDIGDGTTANRFGDDIAIALNTTAQNCIAPALITAATNVVLTANGSNFTGGAVRLTAHFMTLVAPTS